jgi:hypothetical protein
MVSTIGQDFPISDYYRENIIDAVTINRTGVWWSAILVIEDPKTEKPFLGIYKWQKKGDGWKVRSKYNIRSQNDANKFASTVADFANKLG